MPLARDLTGFKNEFFEVLEFHGMRRKRRWWKCKCKCGNIIALPVDEITSGHTKSCGCSRGNYVKHGIANKHPLYKVWKNAKTRCYLKNNQDYKSYGLKGIKVCDEWKHDFKAFYDWCLSNGWKKELVIDRIDPKKDYEPSNCQFITPSENSKKVWTDKRLATKLI
jgi:hypothetical protein